MEYKLLILRDGDPVLAIGVTADEVISAIALALPQAQLETREHDAVVEHPPRKYKSGKKKGTRQRKSYKNGRKLQKEIEADLPTKGRHPETERIEQLLIEGMSVPAILEKVDVSPPTVYIIKNRLKREGKVT